MMPLQKLVVFLSRYPDTAIYQWRCTWHCISKKVWVLLQWKQRKKCKRWVWILEDRNYDIHPEKSQPCISENHTSLWRGACYVHCSLAQPAVHFSWGPCLCLNISLVSTVKTRYYSLSVLTLQSFPVFRLLWIAAECPSFSPQPLQDLTPPIMYQLQDICNHLNWLPASQLQP